MNEDLGRLYDKICQNRLKLNVNKTKAMIITNRRIIDMSNVNIKVAGSRIQIEKCIKYLGVFIDDKLRFRDNILNVCAKTGRKVGVLSRLRNELNMQQKISIYRSIVEPHFTYCASILFLANDGEIGRMQKLQNKCMRNILKLNRRSNVRGMLNTLEFMSVSQLIVFNTLILIFKMVRGQCPEYLCEKIKFRGDDEFRSRLRNRNDIEKIRATKKSTQNSVFFRGIELFNNLTDELRNETSIEKFKTKLRKYVTENLM